jgi:hypothetical protein
MFYIIGDTTATSEAIDVFSYDPVSSGSYTITYSLSPSITIATL